jgi:HlyD family secretion protein
VTDDPVDLSPENNGAGNPWWRQWINGKRLKYLVFAAGLILLGVVGLYFLTRNAETNGFTTAQVERGNLTVFVTATGVLEPVNQVEVGTEISGTVKSVEVDFNDHVKVGEVLARLDTAQLEARARQAKAALDLAHSKVAEAQATVIETRNTNQRMQQLAAKQLCSKEQCDAAKAAYSRALAALASARAQVTQAQAQLDSDNTALKKSVIRSPINGIVLQRQIEPGQTVAASLQTPVLFVLAESLAQMELHVAVDEADVGQVKEGQEATFTVDAYPNETFPAKIVQVRSAPKTVEGVVTYETVLSVNNNDLMLRPGMTATADITVNKLENVLLVPNAALRFTPPVPEKSGDKSGGLVGQLMPHRPRHNRQPAESLKRGEQRVWILRDKVPVAVPIKVGATDGRVTEVMSNNLEPGQAVLVGTASERK